MAFAHGYALRVLATRHPSVAARHVAAGGVASLAMYVLFFPIYRPLPAAIEQWSGAGASDRWLSATRSCVHALLFAAIVYGYFGV